jgi:hypothetical protein
MYSPGSTLLVKANLNLYAQWKAVGGGAGGGSGSGGGGKSPVTPGGPAESAGSSSPDTGDPSDDTGAARAPSKPERAIPRQTEPESDDVNSGGLPFGGFRDKNHWSLLSLILSAIALILSIALVIGAIARWRRRRRSGGERGEQGFSYDGGSRPGVRSGAGAVVSASFGGAGVSDDEDEQLSVLVLRVLAIFFGILTLVVWLVLDILELPMAWVNRWTVDVGIVFIVHLALFIAYKVRLSGEDDSADESYG